MLIGLPFPKQCRCTGGAFKMATLNIRAPAADNQHPRTAARGRRSGEAAARRLRRANEGFGAGRALFRATASHAGRGRAKVLKDVERPRLAVLTANRVTKVATWNARSLCQPRQVAQLVHLCIERGVEVLMLQEHQLRVSGEYQTRKVGWGWELHIVTAPPHPSKGGVAMLVAPTVAWREIGYENHRMMWMCVEAASGTNGWLINVYAPHSESRATEHQVFRSALDTALSKARDNEYLVVAGDFNAALRPGEGNARHEPTASAGHPRTPAMSQASRWLDGFLDSQCLESAATMRRRTAQPT